MRYKKEFKRWLPVVAGEHTLLYEIVCKYFEEVVPEYFWEVAASSTGKYHPKLSLGKGGLLRHTKMALLIAEEMLNLEVYKHISKAEVYVALMVHDTIKHGLNGSKYTVKDHAQQAAKQFYDIFLSVVKEDEKAFIKTNVSDVMLAIKAHMGQWDKDYILHEFDSFHDDELVRFVHLCDYLASRKIFDYTEEELDEI